MDPSFSPPPGKWHQGTLDRLQRKRLRAPPRRKEITSGRGNRLDGKHDSRPGSGGPRPHRQDA